MSKKKEATIEILADAWLTAVGIQTTVYIGHDTSDPQIDQTETFEALIDSALEGYGWAGKFARSHEEEIEEVLKTLKNAYEYAERRIQEIGFHEIGEKAAIKI
jgi:hypothetical protein